MYHLSTEQAMAALEVVVAEAGEDYVYESPRHMQGGDESCFYVHRDPDGSDARPGCLVGTALHRLGVPLGELEKHEGTDAFTMLWHITDLPDRARGAFSGAQEAQDTGETWGEALRQAKRVLDNG